MIKNNHSRVNLLYSWVKTLEKTRGVKKNVEKCSWKILGGKFGEKKSQYFSTKSSNYRDSLENDLNFIFGNFSQFNTGNRTKKNLKFTPKSSHFTILFVSSQV